MEPLSAPEEAYGDVRPPTAASPGAAAIVIEDGHPRAVANVGKSTFAADSIRAAGDNNDLACEITCHRDRNVLIG